jgi:Fic family protein
MARTKNDISQWLKFFLAGVIQTAGIGVTTLNEIVDLRDRIEHGKIPAMGKRSRQGAVLLRALFSRPKVTVKDVQEISGLSPKAANDLAQAFLAAGILTETTGFQRNRVFSFEDYLRLFR